MPAFVLFLPSTFMSAIAKFFFISVIRSIDYMTESHYAHRIYLDVTAGLAGMGEVGRAFTCLRKETHTSGE